MSENDSRYFIYFLEGLIIWPHSSHKLVSNLSWFICSCAVWQKSDTHRWKSLSSSRIFIIAGSKGSNFIDMFISHRMAPHWPWRWRRPRGRPWPPSSPPPGSTPRCWCPAHRWRRGSWSENRSGHNRLEIVNHIMVDCGITLHHHTPRANTLLSRLTALSPAALTGTSPTLVQWSSPCRQVSVVHRRTPGPVIPAVTRNTWRLSLVLII